MTGHNPKGAGQSSNQAFGVGREGAGRFAPDGRFTPKAPNGARLVMSHDQSTATNANPASRSQTSQTKTHRLVNSSNIRR